MTPKQPAAPANNRDGTHGATEIVWLAAIRLTRRSPRRDHPERWARVDAIMHSLEGYLPIELYKIGEVYFVRDGNHRVSVARANGLTHIEAYVTEIETDVDLTLDDFERDQWIIKIERADFLKRTQLDELRPGNNVALTEPGRYRILLRHIAVHQYFRNLDLERAGSEERLRVVRRRDELV
jgi:hypothetical protein